MIELTRFVRQVGPRPAYHYCIKRDGKILLITLGATTAHFDHLQWWLKSEKLID